MLKVKLSFVYPTVRKDERDGVPAGSSRDWNALGAGNGIQFSLQIISRRVVRYLNIHCPKIGNKGNQNDCLGPYRVKTRPKRDCLR